MKSFVKFSLCFALLTLSATTYGYSLNTEEKNIDFCDGCKTFINTVKYYADQNYTYNEIEQFVMAACSYLGPGYSHICDFVAMYGVKALINWTKTMNPEEVCHMVRLCSINKFNNEKCSLCKFITSQIITYITEGHTVNEIKKFIVKLCNNMMYKRSQVCINIIDYGLDELIEFLKSGMSEKKICDMIKLC